MVDHSPSIAGTTTSLRLFFALWPRPEVQQKLAAAGQSLLQQVRGKPTRTELLHLTLAFLGDISAERLPALVDIGERLPKSDFMFELNQLGCWMPAGIGWIGPRATPVRLLPLLNSLQAGLKESHFPIERRRFMAHITLLRKAESPFRGDVRPAIEWRVDELRLVASQLSATGPAYRSLHRWQLAE